MIRCNVSGLKDTLPLMVSADYRLSDSAGRVVRTAVFQRCITGSTAELPT